MPRLCLFLPNWLGDLVMATPALRAIRRRFADAHITGILRPNLAEVLAGTDLLDEQWLFDPRSPDRQQRRLGLVWRMRQARFDLAILLTNSMHTALLAWFGGARRRLGYARDGRSLLLSDRVYPRRERRRIVPEPVVDSYLCLAAAAGCAAEPPKLQLAVTPEEESVADRAWANLGLRRDGKVIALNSSGAYGAAKLWPVGHCAELARRIANSLDHDVLILCGPNERDVARQIATAACHPRVFSLADQAVGIPLLKAALGRVRLLVTTDSGPRHVAAALGKPVVTLLGPTTPIWIENPTVEGINLQKKLDCIGCYARVCPLGHHRCMQELLPQEVLAAVEELLFPLRRRPNFASRDAFLRT